MIRFRPRIWSTRCLRYSSTVSWKRRDRKFLRTFSPLGERSRFFWSAHSAAFGNAFCSGSFFPWRGERGKKRFRFSARRERIFSEKPFYFSFVSVRVGRFPWLLVLFSADTAAEPCPSRRPVRSSGEESWVSRARDSRFSARFTRRRFSSLPTTFPR